MKISDFQNKMKTLAKKEGIDLFGVADITSARDFISEQAGGKYLGDLTRAVSIGVHISDATVNQLYQH